MYLKGTIYMRHEGKLWIVSVFLLMIYIAQKSILIT